MDMQLINKIIEIMGNDSAVKLACGISRPGSINMELDKSKIERAQFFEILKPNKLELTDMGKIFVVKLMFDYADSLIDGDKESDEEEWEDEDDWQDIDEDDENWEEEDWDEEDEDLNEWEEWEDEGDDEDDEKNYRPKKGRKR